MKEEYKNLIEKICLQENLKYNHNHTIILNRFYISIHQKQIKKQDNKFIFNLSYYKNLDNYSIRIDNNLYKSNIKFKDLETILLNVIKEYKEIVNFEIRNTLFLQEKKYLQI